MTIGISGHQDLGTDAQIAWVTSTLAAELAKREYRKGISSLAAGADQLFARLILESGHDLQAIIPCQQYGETFSTPEERAAFELFVTKSVDCKVLEFEEPTEDAFYQAGQRVVDLSNLMFFIWDGKPAKGYGGTADIVNYAVKRERPYVHINLLRREVTEVLAAAL